MSNSVRPAQQETSQPSLEHGQTSESHARDTADIDLLCMQVVKAASVAKMGLEAGARALKDPQVCTNTNFYTFPAANNLF